MLLQTRHSRPDLVAASSATKRRTEAALVVGLALAAGWGFGLVRFLRASGIVEATLPRRKPDPPGEHNLADWQLGPRVRASSYHKGPVDQHHPLFLVDGRSAGENAPTLLEKWVSQVEDRHPWVEVWWREPHQLARVVLTHAGAREGAELTLARYRLTCLRAEGPGPALDVAGNREAVATHALSCDRARGIRLDASLEGHEVVRLFELEAWGE